MATQTETGADLPAAESLQSPAFLSHSFGLRAAPLLARIDAGARAFHQWFGGDFWLHRLLENNRALTRTSFSCVAGLLDVAAILFAAIFASTGYNFMAHGWTGFSESSMQVCLSAAIVFVVANIGRHSYAISDYVDLSGHAQRTFALWNMAFLSSATLGFMTKTIEESSRGAFLAFYFVALLALYAERAALVLLTKHSAQSGGVLATRVMLVGFARDIENFMRLREPAKQGMDIVTTAILRDEDGLLDADIAKATAHARSLAPDDIIVVVPWARAPVIDRCVLKLALIPASIHIHLEPECALNRIVGPKVSNIGAIPSFRLKGSSMNTADIVIKQLCDIAIAAISLVALTPLFVLVAVAIKLDSGGPVLFFQTRHGFNMKEFRIAKFRSMTTMEDGGDVKQATTQDARVTRVGAWLRQFNVDELPQLLNVLRGEMSLVGPRPHALVHDEMFESEVVLYARRYNVKPGITGWAQVNGLRGPTNTSDKINRRVQHDLYYINNWSLPLDMWILLLTIFSKKAYRNAL